MPPVDRLTWHRPAARRALWTVAAIAAAAPAFVDARRAIASTEILCAGAPTAIPDGGPGVGVAFAVPSPSPPATLTLVEFDLTIAHPWVGDLSATLIAPWGAQVTLLDRPGIPSSGWPGPWGCGFANISCRFTDLASAPAETACDPGANAISGNVRPLSPLAPLKNHAPQGTWTLLVSDAIAIDAGTVTSACLRLTLSGACPADLDGSGAVNGADLAQLLGHWGNAASFPAGDLNHDGQINGADLGILLSAWGPC